MSSREWYIRNRNKVLAKNAQWRANNREKVRVHNREWKKRNRRARLLAQKAGVLIAVARQWIDEGVVS